jgi:hypothetical protein
LNRNRTTLGRGALNWFLKKNNLGIQTADDLVILIENEPLSHCFKDERNR